MTCSNPTFVRNIVISVICMAVISLGVLYYSNNDKKFTGNYSVNKYLEKEYQNILQNADNNINCNKSATFGEMDEYMVRRLYSILKYDDINCKKETNSGQGK